MLTKLREPFGKAGLIVAIVALIAALGGGAYAASGGLTGKQKNEVKAIAKQFAGKPGAEGKQGPVGPAGQTGPAGSKGDAGSNGANGSPGAPGTAGGAGAAGKSVEARTIATGEPTQCEEMGGAEYEVEGSGEAAEICNGGEGSPWAVGGLPKGATETGSWAFTGSAADGGVFAPISFSVPLRAAITETSKVHVVTGATTECPGSVTNPKALEGNLCVYIGEVEGATYEYIAELENGQFNRASVAGALLHFGSVTDGAYGFGSWAVTGS
ncbi:MAG: collagen-like protein [Actinobacteria bacterium]|nr:collagen-like protein [Actinomycetota bacterium]